MGRHLFYRRKEMKSPPSNPSTSNSSSGNTTSTSCVHPPAFLHRMQNSDDLRHVFNKFDANSDGSISRTELEAMLNSLGKESSPDEVESMMRAADLDGDGFISLDEFIAVNRAETDWMKCLEDLKDAFTIFDRDKNGLISAEELRDVLCAIGEESSLSECRRMIEEVDQNGDGSVNFDEFLQMMTRSYHPVA